MSIGALFNGIKRGFARSHPIGLGAVHAPKTHDLPPWSPSSLLIKDLETKCRHPVFSVVHRLAAVKPDMRFRELEPMFAAERQFSDVQQWNWMSVAEGKDFQETMDRLQALGVRVAERSWESLLSRGIATTPLDASSAQPTDTPDPQPPTWLVMHVLCNQAKTYDDMVLTLRLVFYHLPYALPELQPSVLIMTGIRLAQFRMVAPLRQLVHHFLQLSPRLNADHLNLMIRAVALLPASKEASTIAVGLVHLSIANRMTLTEHTFDALLNSSFCDLAVETAVRSAMAAQDFQPTIFHLRELLKVNTRYRRSKHAAEHLFALREALKQARTPRVPWALWRKQWAGGLNTPDNRAFVASMRETKSAHEVLTRLTIETAKQGQAQREGRSTPSATYSFRSTLFVRDWVAGLQVAARDPRVRPDALLRVFRAGERDFAERMPAVAQIVVIRGLLRKWAVKEAVRLWDERWAMIDLPWSNINAFIVGVGVTALTLNNEPHRAFRLLELAWRKQYRKHLKIRKRTTKKKKKDPKTPAEDVPIAGSPAAHQDRDAALRTVHGAGSSSPAAKQSTSAPQLAAMPAVESSYWEEMSHEGLDEGHDLHPIESPSPSPETSTMDPSINRGVFSVEPPAELDGDEMAIASTNKRYRKPSSLNRWSASEVLNLTAINSFMASLHRTGRADVVFAVWDKMETLYGLRPDVVSLNILLHAARWSTRYNMTIRGALAHLGVGVHVERAPSLESSPDEEADLPLGAETVERQQARSWIEELVAPGVRHVRHSLWNGQSAALQALRIATRTILGNWPYLRSVKSPVPLVERSSVSRTIVEKLIGGRRAEHQDQAKDASDKNPSPLVLFADELPESMTFMQIAPTDVTFRVLLDIMELYNLASEVPLVMAWMHRLNIKPSKETLATALVYWSGAPDVDRWGGRQHSYRVFHAWLADWVGAAGMPGAKEMSTTLKRIHYFNAMTREELTAKRMEKAARVMVRVREDEGRR